MSNYRLMSPEDFNKCLTLQPFGGLSVQVDTKYFKEFHVYYRGIREVEVTDTFLWIFKRKRKTIQFCRIFVLAEYKTNLYISSVYSCHVSLISSAFVKSISFLSFIVPILNEIFS